MREIDPLLDKDEEHQNEDGPLNQQQDKQPREIGKFIVHEDFNGEIDEEMVDMEELRQASKDPIQKVFVMDHDFVCLQKRRNEEYDSEFARGVDYYLHADWP